MMLTHYYADPFKGCLNPQISAGHGYSHWVKAATSGLIDEAMSNGQRCCLLCFVLFLVSFDWVEGFVILIVC